MSGRRPGRPREADRPDRVGDITRAAVELFGQQSYAGVTFSSVARRAGMTPAALYRYHDDKAALYLHAARMAREQVWTTIGDQFEPQGSAVDDFVEMTRLIGTLRSPEMRAGLRLLASVQVNAVHNKELRALLEERWQVRHTIVGDIGRRGHSRGELAQFADPEDAALVIEVLFDGWANDAYGAPKRRPLVTRIVTETIASLTSAGPIKEPHRV